MRPEVAARDRNEVLQSVGRFEVGLESVEVSSGSREMA
jgi:hypothetical protein